MFRAALGMCSHEQLSAYATEERKTMNSITTRVPVQTNDAPPVAATLRYAITVIGYGDPQRGDDAVGQVVAEQVAAWGMPEVHADAVHRLTPDLAETVAASACVMFVDARALGDHRSGSAHVSIQPIAPVHVNSVFGHITDPRDLLALTETLYGAHPRAWRIHVPALEFGFGSQLSSKAQEGVQAALRVVRYMISSMRSSSAT
jgi:hydrogenase maturation protease